MNQPEPPKTKLDDYKPVRLIWGIKKDSGEMEGRICESQEEIIEARKLFESYREFKLVEIK
jgi:hypothetical protein